jgi:hypothetical protein
MHARHFIKLPVVLLQCVLRIAGCMRFDAECLAILLI